VTALVMAIAAGYGVHLVYTSVVFGWHGVAPGPATVRRPRRPVIVDWLRQSGLGSLRPVEAGAVMTTLTGVGAVIGWSLFGGVLPPLAIGLAGAAAPVLAARGRRESRRATAREAWPRLIEELRIKTSTLGRSIPQALFDVGATAPDELRPAFERARREWLLSTDFERTLAVLRDDLADPTADVVCETLLVAHQTGGTEVDRTLQALIDDRIMDLQGRKDARSRQAGARFARSFTVLAPIGMALVGLSIGQGRKAYETATGQLLVLVGLAVMAGCWLWAGRIMRLPEERRVFAEAAR
jgi:tight adherence protein B